MPMLILGNSSNAAMTGGCVVDIPRIVSRISSQMGGILLEGMHGLAMERAEKGDIAFIEGLSIFSKDHVSVIRSGRSGNARAVAPKKFLFLFRFFCASKLGLILGNGRRGSISGSVLGA